MARAQWQPEYGKANDFPWSTATTVDLAAQGVKFTGNIIEITRMMTIYEATTRNGKTIWVRVVDLFEAPDNYARTMLPPRGMTLNTDLDMGPNVAQIVDIQCFEVRWVFMFHDRSYLTTIGRMEREAPLRFEDFTRVKNLLSNIITGLNNLLSNGYHHGDLCHDNIYVGHDRKLYLAGFSLVPLALHDPYDFYIGPNYKFRPPEPVLVPDETYHPSASDVFAFGILVAGLASGQKIMSEADSRHLEPDERLKLHFAKLTVLLDDPNQIYERYKEFMNDDLLDLVQKCLVPHEVTRIKVGLILEHEYFKPDSRVESGVQPNLKLDEIVLGRLREREIIVKSALGTGSFGQVYRVRYRGVRRALKVQELQGRRPSSEMIIEKEIFENCIHRYLCRAYLVYDDEWAMIHVMELATTDLNGHMKKLGPTESHEAQFIERRMNKWIHQVCLGIQHMHQKGYAHCDIKPHNILIRANGEACVADFGLALKMQRPGIKSRVKGGTKNFMSPQLFYSEPYLPFANDIWAIGIVTHAALTCQYNGLINYRDYSGLQHQLDTIEHRVRAMKDFSRQARDFIVKCCVVEENERQDINVFVGHPWFHSGIASPYDQFGPVTPQKSPAAPRRTQTTPISIK